jgi:ribosomal protein L39E
LENLASANIKKIKGAKHKKQEEALPIWMGLLNAEKGTAT